VFWTVFLRFVQIWHCFGLHLSFKHTETVFPKKVRVKCISPTYYTTPPDALTINIDPTHFYQLLITSILWVVPNSLQNLTSRKLRKLYFSRKTNSSAQQQLNKFCPQLHLMNQLLILLPCMFYLLNFCSWKIVLKRPHSTKSPAQRNLHALYHVNVVANYWVCAHQPTS